MKKPIIMKVEEHNIYFIVFKTFLIDLISIDISFD